MLEHSLLQQAECLGRSRRKSVPVVAKLATSALDFQNAWRLRYEAYASAGYLHHSDKRIYLDKYDNDTNRTLLLYRGDTPIASARVCILLEPSARTPECAIPAYEIFQEEIDQHLALLQEDGRPERSIEVTRLSRSPQFGSDLAVTQALFRMIGYLIIHFNASVMFAAVSANHIPFYRRMGFKLIGNPRSYPDLAVQTALMGCDCHGHRPINGLLSSLGSLSKQDPIYRRFMEGQEVEVTPEQRRQSVSFTAEETIPTPKAV